MTNSSWWLIPLSKWVITPVINGISRVDPLITGVITHLLSGMSHQVQTMSWLFLLVSPQVQCVVYAEPHSEPQPPRSRVQPLCQGARSPFGQDCHWDHCYRTDHWIIFLCLSSLWCIEKLHFHNLENSMYYLYIHWISRWTLVEKKVQLRGGHISLGPKIWDASDCTGPVCGMALSYHISTARIWHGLNSILFLKLDWKYLEISRNI